MSKVQAIHGRIKFEIAQGLCEDLMMERKPSKFKDIVVLTGAGISAESGIRTFRAADGLWEDHRIEDVASPEGFDRDPELVQRLYNLRRKQLFHEDVKPNAAHFALAELESQWQGSYLLVTQNVDNLHERALSKNVLHMHGELLKIFCTRCRFRLRWESDLGLKEPCPKCQAHALRPEIVWFGEVPYQMDEIMLALRKCDLFVSIGTSGLVYPAAGFAQAATHAYKIEVNLEATAISRGFDELRFGKAGVEVPKLMSELLQKSSD